MTAQITVVALALLAIHLANGDKNFRQVAEKHGVCGIEVSQVGSRGQVPIGVLEGQRSNTPELVGLMLFSCCSLYRFIV